MTHHQNLYQSVAVRNIKNYFSRNSPILLLLLFIAISSFDVFANKATEQDASFKKYFNKCISQLHSPEVLKMADTLYNQAKKVENRYYQILARNVVLDYYYFQADKDKILRLVPEIKRMCRENNELDVYYFIWGSRLITFYLKNGQVNHALAEAQNMLREAQNDNHVSGIAECYKAMANIYRMQSNSEQASSNLKKLIDIVEKQKPDDINLIVYYYSLINNLIQLERIDEAEETLKKGQLIQDKTNPATAYQRLCLAQGFLLLYIEKEDYIRAKEAFEKIESLFDTYKELEVYSVYLRDSKMKYYMSVKDYPKALAALDSIELHNSTSETNLVVLNKRGEIYWNMNEKATAAKHYRDYIFASDSIRKCSMQNSADEIAGLLNLRQLEQEKQQLMIDIQNRRLATTYWAIGALAFILIIAALVIIHVYRLNRQLKESKQEVIRQNDALLQSSEDLRKAKNRAEEASRIKTEFIQNITHEVRTPLNSIVGFSQVLVEYIENPETEEFTSLITVNSNYLLRLFDGVLELSNIDHVNCLPYDTVDTIDSSCLSAINEAKPLVKDGVELVFHPSDENVRIYTNPSYVRLILNYLLHNAAKFTQTGSITLEYAVSLPENVIRYSVTDTGVGIPSEQQEAVFERFIKLDTFAQGSGLGLAVSRAIATKLEGSLHVDAEYTTGARLVLTLPFIPEKHETKT